MSYSSIVRKSSGNIEDYNFVIEKYNEDIIEKDSDVSYVDKSIQIPFVSTILKKRNDEDMLSKICKKNQ